MGRVPIEALLEVRPPDRPRYTISYAPSGTILAWLRERPRPDRGSKGRPRRLLAVGDPEFERTESPGTPLAPPPDHGVVVQRVRPGSAAARGGIAPGDVLLRLDGKVVNRAPDDRADVDPGTAQEPGHAVTIWRDGTLVDLTLPPGRLDLVFDLRPPGVVIAAQHAADELVRRSRGAAPERLLHSRHEVAAIAGLFEQPEVLLGPDASEARLIALAGSDRLRQFDILHFATHGVLNPQDSMRSALLLASDLRSEAVARALRGEPVHDGALTAEQILRTWKLDADLVTLSACDTALGQRSDGEGYLGFSQALFLAGARSLVLSLWKVDDRATSLLMVRFYENLLGKRPGLDRPLPRALALGEAKQWLRALTADEAGALADRQRGTVRPVKPGPRQPEAPKPPRPYDHPYFWAAFILVGDPW
jgi:hypothetical protein